MLKGEYRLTGLRDDDTEQGHCGDIEDQREQDGGLDPLERPNLHADGILVRSQSGQTREGDEACDRIDFDSGPIGPIFGEYGKDDEGKSIEKIGERRQRKKRENEGPTRGLRCDDDRCDRRRRRRGRGL